MGEVYEVVDLELNEVVALKTLLADRLKSEEMLARLKRETQLSRRINHPNVCRIYDLGYHSRAEGENVPYLTMEFLRGETLAAVIKREGRFSVERALPLVRQMIGALAAAHQLEIIHRDFKCSNVMLVFNGKELDAKVTDFGLARTAAGAEDATLTFSGQAVGTPPYMPPEQFRGEATKASDIYALGVVMHEMVTGALPFRPDTPPAERPKPSPRAYVSDLEPRWEAAIVRCLDSEAAYRFRKAEDVEAALTGLDQEEIQTAPFPLPPGETRRIHPLPFIALLGALALAPATWFAYHKGVLKSPFATSLPDQKHIAILPFRNLSKNPNDDLFCEGLTGTLSSQLSQLERFQKSFWVIPALDTRLITDSEGAYRRLGATMVVTGTFQRLPNGNRLVLSLVDVRDHRQLESRMLETPSDDLSKLEGEAWLRVADMLDLQLNPGQVHSLEAGKAKAPGAYEYYEQGLGYFHRNGIDDLKHAVWLFQEAISRDPSYALAHAGLSSALQLLFEVTKDQNYLQQAKASAVRAAALGPDFAPVHFTLGQLAELAGENQEARRELNTALRLDPGLIDAQFYLARLDEQEGKLDDALRQFESAVARRPGYWRSRSELASFYYRHGRFAESERVFKEVLTLLPDDPGTYANLGAVYMSMGRPEEAVRTFESQIRLKPSAGAYTNLGTCLMLLGKYADAVTPMEQAVKLMPDDHEMWRNLADSYRYAPGQASKAPEAYRHALELARRQLKESRNDFETMSSAALYEAHLNNSAEALRHIQFARKREPLNNEIAFTASLVYEILGSRVDAINALRASFECGHSLEDIQREPDLAELRKDARFVTWLLRVEAIPKEGNRNP